MWLNQWSVLTQTDPQWIIPPAGETDAVAALDAATARDNRPGRTACRRGNPEKSGFPLPEDMPEVPTCLLKSPGEARFFRLEYSLRKKLLVQFTLNQYNIPKPLVCNYFSAAFKKA